MKEICQKTLAKSIKFEGIGLHSGKKTFIKLIPGSENQGIIFKRVDLDTNNIIEANYNNVTSAKLCTTLENSYGQKVSTVEHLLAALYITGIDNLTIEIDSAEVPIMDGSSKDFIEGINLIGTKVLNKKRKYLKILEKIEFADKDREISIEPSNNDFTVNFQIDYKNPIIGKQKNIVNFSENNLEDIYHSRTFCLFEDIEKIKKNGLAKGDTLDNAIVVTDNKIMNKEGLRNDKEFVNHKILDLAGDFLLSGYRILGKVICYGGGHELTNTFLKKLMKQNFATKEIELDQAELPTKISLNHSTKLAVNA